MDEITPETAKRGQTYALLSNLFCNVFGFFVTGQLMQLYASDVLALSVGRISTLLAVIPLFSIARIFVIKTVQRHGYVAVATMGAVARLAVIAAIAVIPSSRLGFGTYAALLVGYESMGQIGDMVWQPMLRDITSDQDRGRFFARMRFCFTAFATLVSAAVPFLIHSTITEPQYKLFLAIPFVGHLHRVFWLRRIPEYREKPETKAMSAAPLFARIREILATSRLLRFPLLLTLVFTVSLFPAMTVYLRQVLGIPSNVIAMFGFSLTLGSAGSFLFWGRVSDAMGYRKFLSALFAASILILPLLLFVTPYEGEWSGFRNITPGQGKSILALLAYGFLSGVFEAGAGIGTISIQHHFVDRNDALTSMTLFAAISVLIVSFQNFWLGKFLEHVVIPLGSLVSAPVHVDAAKVFLVAGVAILRILSLAVLKRTVKQD